jgi:hypothetical protein
MQSRKGKTEFSFHKINHRLVTMRNCAFAVKSVASSRLCAFASKPFLKRYGLVPFDLLFSAGSSGASAEARAAVLV